MSVLRKKFFDKETGINLGKESNYRIKKYLINSLICGTIFFWILHLSSMKNIRELIPNLSMFPTQNKTNLAIIALGIVASSASLFLNDQLASNTKIITTQKT